MATLPSRRRCPHLLEINARILVERVSDRRGPRAMLLDVPPDYWAGLARRGFDLVWLMGVWRRSEGSRRVALSEPGLREAYDEALPGWTDRDVAGSPYAVAGYELDPALGRPGDLAVLHRRVNEAGLGLLLDFVPNHVALDHPWTVFAPHRLLGADGLPPPGVEGLYRVGDRHLAHGRDPYFPPWTDTVQLDVFDADARVAMIEELLAVADVCDGVRCDMAMLVLNDVFAGTWAPLLAGRPVPATEFWTDAIAAVRARNERFLFVAEAYWDLGWRLHELGFDAFYDKTLYDRLRSGAVDDLRAHLGGTPHWHDCAVRFVENHDEPRAAAAFGPRALAAAATALTTPGVRLVHDGQRDGRRVRLPVQLVREPREDPDPAMRTAVDRLLALADDRLMHDGDWTLLEVRGEGELPIAWQWSADGRRAIVAVNVTERTAAGTILVGTVNGARDALAVPEIAPTRLETVADGLRVELPPGGAAIVLG
ncbi:MAG: alpha-amylase family protein [Planctomycetota bacterium]